MQLTLRPEDEQRALAILATPRTAAHFAEEYWGPEVADDSPGTRSRRGHALLASMVRAGRARRYSEGGLDLYMAVGAHPVMQPPATLPAEPPLLHVEGDQVVAVERRVLGPLANGGAPAQSTDGQLRVDPSTGEVTRVHVERLGRAQLPATAVAAPAAMLSPHQSAWQVWIDARYRDLQGVQWLLSQALAAPDLGSRAAKLEEVRAKWLPLLVEQTHWARLMSLPELPQLARMAAEMAAPPAPPAPAVGPWPSYGPAWG